MRKNNDGDGSAQGCGANRNDGQTSDPDFADLAGREVHAFITRSDFPCLGAKAAFNAGSYIIRAYDELASAPATHALARDLGHFAASEMPAKSEYATFIAVFRGPLGEDEEHFEQRLWSQLRRLNRIDAEQSAWDSSVKSHPADPRFSFSFAGRALYVIGLHANSSRRSRRFRLPALVFNPHEQFERLRADGKWKRMQSAIRHRDLHLQGSINPMLSDFGERSEARQYSGRSVEENWQAPFEALQGRQAAHTGGCPFKH